MTLTIEDGTIVAGANSFVTLAEANAYFSARHDSAWEAAEDTAKERALVLASDYMTQAWRLKWRGSLVNATQSLTWPRSGVPVPDFFDPFEKQVNVPLDFQDTYWLGSDVVPQEVKDAQMLLARAQMDDAGAVANVLQASLGRVTKREKVGSLEVEYMTPGDGGDARQTTYYWDAERRVQPFFNPTSDIVGSLARS
jgi:hypothetical protein